MPGSTQLKICANTTVPKKLNHFDRTITHLHTQLYVSKSRSVISARASSKTVVTPSSFGKSTIFSKTQCITHNRNIHERYLRNFSQLSYVSTTVHKTNNYKFTNRTNSSYPGWNNYSYGTTKLSSSLSSLHHHANSQRGKKYLATPNTRVFEVYDEPSPRRGAGFWLMILLAVIFLIIITHIDRVPLSGRIRVVLISKAMEIKLGEVAFQQIAEEFGGLFLPPSSKHVRAVQRVATRLIVNSGIQELQKLPWEFHVILHNDANAFVLPGGKVCVFSGILPVMQTEEGMATVLGHEIGHVLARHPAEQMGLHLVMFWAHAIAALVFGVYIPFGDLARLALGRKFSRVHESEADHIGLLLMSRACYDPTSALDFWRRMALREQREPAVFVRWLSTHPSHQERIEHVKKWLPEALQEAEQAGCPVRYSERPQRIKVKWN